MFKPVSIAIDGPGGAGKSTMAKALAKRLGYIYVDTGAIYRTVGLYCLLNGIDPHDEDTLKEHLGRIHVGLRCDEDGVQRMSLNGEDVTDKIRTPEVSMAASDVSSLPACREFLLSMQRDLACENNVVMDGRDIGTVVLPDATYKVFLTASEEVRAERRLKELQSKGISENYEKVLAELHERDEQDRNRAVAPLRQAEDAYLLDSSHMTEEQVLETLVHLVSDNRI